jgi:hypothetical protein
MTLQTPIKPASLASRIDALRRRHRRIDSHVASEHGRPRPDSTVLQALKRERLRLKDQLRRYEGLLQTLPRGQAAT